LLTPFRKREETTMPKEFNSVVVTDIKMPFSSMVVFMIKWAVATIPALIILSVAGSIVFGILGMIFGRFRDKMFM
jgi:hypothetical protein